MVTEESKTKEYIKSFDEAVEDILPKIINEKYQKSDHIAVICDPKSGTIAIQNLTAYSLLDTFKVEPVKSFVGALKHLSGITVTKSKKAYIIGLKSGEVGMEAIYKIAEQINSLAGANPALKIDLAKIPEFNLSDAKIGK